MNLSMEQGAQSVLDWHEQRRGVRPHWRARLLDKPNGERLVAEYALGADGAAGEVVIGKCYAGDDGARTFGVMGEVRAALAALPAKILALPEALWYDPMRRCLVQPRVPGVAFGELAGSADFEAALDLAGEALAELHDTDAVRGEPRRLADHLRELVRPHPMVLAQAVPPLHARIERLLSGLERADATLGASAPSTIHRDFHLRQLFLDERRVWLIDWDLCARGDAALDAGNFLMYLEVRLGEGAQGPARAFLQGYFRRAPESRRPRIELYKGLNYLRRACKAFRLGGADWREQSELMLGRAERSLAAYEGH